MEEKKEFRRYGLSGIYIFDTFPGEEKRQPTCIEDCQEKTRLVWLEGQDKECLVNTANILCTILHNFAESLEKQGIIQFTEKED